MSAKTDRYIEILCWDDIREDISKVNPELATIVDELSPSKKYKLVKVRYNFGDLIINDGVLQLPNSSKRLNPITSPEISPSITSLLKYSPIPLTLLLNKISEVFVSDEDRVLPLKVFGPGEMFGTFETLDYLTLRSCSPLWNVSAGSRSIFILPRINENGSFKKLREYYKIDFNQPCFFSDQWGLFKKISNSEQFKSSWESEIILFSNEWFLPANYKDPAWLKFKLYLFEQGWKQRQQTFKKDELSLLWRVFVNALIQRRLSPPSYLIDTIKHLLLISIGELPGFQPVISDLAAPYHELQQAILNEYGLKKYFPTLMHASWSKNYNCNPVYYSLAFPTLVEGSPDKKYRSATLMLDLKNLANLITTISNHPNVISTTFFENKKFSYFHTDSDTTIRHSSIISSEDSRFINKDFPELIFCSTSLFWRGCIRIQND